MQYKCLVIDYWNLSGYWCLVFGYCYFILSPIAFLSLLYLQILA